MSTESIDLPTATPSVERSAGPVDPASLRRVEMFADLRDDELAWIAAHSERVDLAPGQLLITPGEPAQWMFIALEGTVEVRGAPWRARTNRATPIRSGDAVRVVGIDGLLLEVEPEAGGARDYRH